MANSKDTHKVMEHLQSAVGEMANSKDQISLAKDKPKLDFFALNIADEYAENCENPKNERIKDDCLLYLAGIRDAMILTKEYLEEFAPNFPAKNTLDELQSIFIEYMKTSSENKKDFNTSGEMWRAWVEKFGLVTNYNITFNSAKDYFNYCENPKNRTISEMCHRYLSATIATTMAYGITYDNVLYPNILKGTYKEIRLKVIEHMKGSSDEKLRVIPSVYIIPALVDIYGDKNAKQDNIKK